MQLLNKDRSSDCPLNTPSKIMDSVVNRLFRNATHSAQLKCGKGFSVVFESSRISFVAGLVFNGVPNCVFWTISFFIIFPLKPQLGLPRRKHVGNEIDKTVAPAITDSDSTASIPFPRAILWILATPDHRFPNRVDRVAITTRQPMCNLSLSCDFFVIASAGRGSASGKCGLNEKPFGSAITATVPNLKSSLRSWPYSGKPKDGEPSEFLSSKILATERRGRINFTSVHRSNLSLDVSAVRKLELPFSTPIFAGNN